MNTAIVSSIIGTVGAGFIAVLVVYLQGLRDDIRALLRPNCRRGVGPGWDRGEARSNPSDPGGAAAVCFAGIAGHGERIAALEGAVAAVS